MLDELRRRVEAFRIDGSESGPLTFAARLARENGWPVAFAERVVREYQLFMLLAVTAGHPVCPSEEVDEAWHLHLTYTRSYWKDFCANTLGQPVHHEPTRGGPAEASKHLRMYEATLSAYRGAFGEEPPRDIWPPSEVRFADPARRSKVDRAEHWIVPKRLVKRASATAAALLVALAAMGCAGSLNPFDLVGPEFLAFLIPLMFVAAVLGRLLRQSMRGPAFQPGDENVSLEWHQAAYLAGGAPRLTSAAIARQVAAGALQVSEDGATLNAVGPPPGGLTPAEHALWGQLPLARTREALKAATAAVDAAYAEQAERLAQDGLALRPSQATGVLGVSMIPLLLVVVAFGIPRLIMGLSHGRPVAYLLMTLMGGGTVGLLIAAAGSLRRTRRGDALLRRLTDQHHQLRSGTGLGTAEAAALGVALFGTSALASEAAYAALHGWYPKQTSGSGCGSSGCGTSGCGGGGGCGSGCGGCGGGGD